MLPDAHWRHQHQQRSQRKSKPAKKWQSMLFSSAELFLQTAVVMSF
jgi:hypothetical protein